MQASAYGREGGVSTPLTKQPRGTAQASQVAPEIIAMHRPRHDLVKIWQQ